MIGPIKTVEMHTGGEPLRIVTEGIPFPEGLTLLEKRRHLRQKADKYRRFLMLEPRGHRDMYGALIVPADNDSADFGVIFMHNEGYSTMCGHGIIALGRFAVDQGLVKKEPSSTSMVIQCPCGNIETNVQTDGNHFGTVTFKSVPAFAYKIDQFVNTLDYGPVEIDIAYGGAFYGILDASSIGLDVKTSSIESLNYAARHLGEAIRQQIEITHPGEADLSFLYGIIFTDGQSGAKSTPSVNICVFADGQIDRSPTGSGVTARLAVAHAKGETTIGRLHSFESITGTVFTGKVVAKAEASPYKAVTVEVGGRAHYSGSAEFIMEEDDMLAGGFLLR
ncbi:MAG: proline racemase family protein [Sneathiella sp.]